MTLDEAIAACPVIAILRGLDPASAIATVEALAAAGIRVAEVPLNSPDPARTVALLRAHFGDRMIIGAGTVLNVGDVSVLAKAQAQIIVSPDTAADVIRAALHSGMEPVPGFATPGDAFAAIRAGARWLKLFPAAGNLSLLGALRPLLPDGISIVAVGGVGADNARDYLEAGCQAVGVGSDLYRPGQSPQVTAERAAALVEAVTRPLPRVSPATASSATIAESPIIAGEDGHVFWTEPVERRLQRFDPHSRALVALPVEEPLWSLASGPDGRLSAAGETAFFAVETETGGLTRLAHAPLAPGVRLNDMTADRQGGLWAGSMHMGLLTGRGSILHLPAGMDEPQIVATGLDVPNGMAFDAAETTLYVIDTLKRALLAYPVNTSGDGLGEPRIITDFGGLPGKPDGMAIDPEGYLWVAMWGGGCIVRIAPSGAACTIIELPAPNVSSLCIEGTGCLYVTTSHARMNDWQRAQFPHAGALFEVSLDSI